MFKANITVTLRPSILDPQGKAMQHALHDLGQTSITQIRAGKHIEMLIDVATEGEAHQIAENACKKLLANEVMEDFAIEIERASEGATA